MKRRKEKRDLTLEDYFKSRVGNPKERVRMLREIYKEYLNGRIELVDKNPPKDFIDYLIRLEYSLWVWVSLLIVILTLISIILTQLSPVLLYLRYVVGLLFVVFLPGFTVIEAFYPRERDLKPIERLALSLGLSLALVPLIALALAYSPWGVRLEPMIVSLTIFIVSMLMLAAWRKYSREIVYKITS